MNAARAKAYLELLARQRIGRRQVAALTGLHPAHLKDIKHGRITQIRQTTLDRILACPIVPAKGTVTTAWWAKKYVDALRAEGYTDAQIERWIGCDPGPLMRRTRVRHRTAMQVAYVYRGITGDADLGLR